MNKLIATLVCLFVFISAGFSQTEWGVEGQHAFGKDANDNMVGGRYEGFNGKSSWSFGLTYNFSSQKSYSQYKGFGFYFGYRYGFNLTENGNPFVGFRASFSFNNFAGKEKANSSTVTPEFEAGYHLIFGTHVFTTPSIAYGYNIKLTKPNNSLQEDEGNRFITSLALGYRF